MSRMEFLNGVFGVKEINIILMDCVFCDLKKMFAEINVVKSLNRAGLEEKLTKSSVLKCFMEISELFVDKEKGKTLNTD